MKKVLNIILKIILTIFSITLLWIIMMALLDYDKIIYYFNPIYLIIGICLYIPTVIFFYNKIVPKVMNFKYLPHIILTIYFILCLVSGYIFMVNPSWDMGVVNVMASKCAEMITCKFDYLLTFPNNAMVTLFYIVIFKIMRIINFTDYVLIATIINSLIMAISGILLYLISKETLNKEKQTLLLFLLLFTTPFYLYCSIYYTDTIALFMSLLIIYLFLIITKQKNKTKKIILTILLGISVVLGFKFKTTTIFVVIAYILYEILNQRLINDLKKSKVLCIIFCITIIISYILLQVTFNKSFFDDKERYMSKKMPYYNWIALGINGRGGFDQNHWDIISSLPTYEEKNQFAKTQIKIKLKEYNVNTFIKHLNKKLKFAWTDGTYFAPEKLRRLPVHKNILHEFIIKKGKYTYYYKYFPQVMHISMLIFILIGAVYLLIKNKLDSKNTILYITMFGFITFLLIWENRSRYILPVVPLMMIMQLKGIEVISKYKRK